jgi:hypothetical protein
VIQQAIVVQLSSLLERFKNVKTLHGQRAVVRNGYLPERNVLTAPGPIAVKVPGGKWWGDGIHTGLRS